MLPYAAQGVSRHIPDRIPIRGMPKERFWSASGAFPEAGSTKGVPPGDSKRSNRRKNALPTLWVSLNAAVAVTDTAYLCTFEVNT